MASKKGSSAAEEYDVGDRRNLGKVKPTHLSIGSVLFSLEPAHLPIEAKFVEQANEA
ncbi:hypothetical protein E2562_003630, partial [Oryza meyeriana var. granulata]